MFLLQQREYRQWIILKLFRMFVENLEHLWNTFCTIIIFAQLRVVRGNWVWLE